MPYSSEDYKLFRLTADDKSTEEEALVKVTELLNNTQLNIAAKYRALYISVSHGRFKIFEHILKDIGVKNPHEWAEFRPNSARNAPSKGGVQQTVDAEPTVFQAIGYLLATFKSLDVYFRDRDGQSLMHYIAKDGYTEVFEHMVEVRSFNPLCRDRVGRTAWDLAYRKLSADINRTNDDQKLALKGKFPDLIQTYVLRAPERLKGKDCDSEESQIISVIKFNEEDGPWNKTRFSPKEFLTDNDPCWLKEGYETLAGSVNGDVGLIWIQLDENNDAVFTAILNKVCRLKQYDTDTIAQVFNFQAQTFLEQDQGEAQFKFRQPLFKTHRVPLESPRSFIELMSIVIPYFDSGILKGGERAAHLDLGNLKRTTTMNIHVQRTLDESYYLGLDSKELDRRNKNPILDQPKFRPLTKNTLLVSQLWLWKINNVVITACPRGNEYKSSHLFDHTLSLLRDTGPSVRKELASD